MKTIKVLLLAVLSLAATTTFAQEGKWWFDGNLGFNSSKSETNNVELGSSSFDINVSGNYMIADEWSLGLGLGYNTTSTDWMKDYANKSNMFNITLQGYYFKPLMGRLVWAPRAYFTYGMGTYTHEAVTGDVDGDLSLMRLCVEPLSFKYVAGEHLAFTFAFNVADVYFQTTSNDYTDTDNTNINFQCGNIKDLTIGNLGFKIGFAWTL